MEAVPELRPLGVGDIVDRVFTIYRSRLLRLLAVAAIPYLLFTLLIVALAIAAAPTFLALAPALAGDIEAVTAVLPSIIGGLVAIIAIVLVAALVTSLVQSAALVDCVAASYMGKEETVGGALRIGLQAAPRLLGMGLLAFLAFISIWAAGIVLMAEIREWWAFLIGIVGLSVLSFYMAASWMVSPAVAILEGAGPLAALMRSWRLSEGNRWRILALILLLVILQTVLSSLLSVVLVASLVTDRSIQVIVQQVVNLLATIAWAPIYWGTFAVLYYDLRVRKEALDLQLAAEALPRAT